MKKKNNTYFIDSSLSDYDYLVLDNLSNLNEEHDKTIKENEKVSDSVYFHGSVEDIKGYLNKPINWITKDFDYAKTFALDNGYVYECSANLGNLLDVDKTDARVFDLIPSTPLKFSREFTAIIRKLNVSEDSIRRIIDNVADEYKVNPYRLAIRPVVRSIAFKRILEGLGFDGVRAIEYDSINNKNVETFGLFDQVKVLGKVNESLDEDIEDYLSEYSPKDFENMAYIQSDTDSALIFLDSSSISDNKLSKLFKQSSSRHGVLSDLLTESLKEEKAITWGDLDVAKKTDTRKMMSGRGTGHFGTGFYFVGKEGPYGLDGDGNFKNYDYEPSRPIYEIDLDKYNLYRPKDNDSAYRLHDAMASINNYYSPDMNKYLFSNIDTDALMNNFYDAVANLDEDVEDDDFDDLDFDIDDIEDTEEDAVEKDSTKDNSKYIDAAKSWIEKYDLADWINTGYDDLDAWLDKNKNKLGLIEKSVEDAINNRDKYLGYVEYAIDVLCKVFNTNRNTLMALCKAFYNMKSDDTISTLLFKEFGYEGVDVTHLNHDAQGLSGLDNFGYGTVIYDLKPGTFKKIKEPRRGGSIHAKAGESLTEENESNILDALDREFGQEEVYMWSTYILPNGHFLNPDNSKWWDKINEDPEYEHCDFEEWALSNGYKGKIKDIWDNCIKMNVTSPYLGMPDKARPTPEQLRAVKEILNHQKNFYFEQPDWDNLQGDADKMGPRVLGVFSPKGDKLFDLDVSDAEDIVRAINQAYVRGSFLGEDLKDTTTVYTYQSPEVLKQLQNGETYIASYERGMLSNDSYKELTRVLELNNCPIFGGLSKEDTEDMMNSSGLDVDDKVLLTLEVPTSEVHKMGYYDWTDYIYYYIDGQEEPELSIKEFENILRNYSGDTPCQVVIDRIEPEWLVNSENVSITPDYDEDDIDIVDNTKSLLIVTKQNQGYYVSVSEIDNSKNYDWDNLSKESIINLITKYSNAQPSSSYPFSDIAKVGIADVIKKGNGWLHSRKFGTKSINEYFDTVEDSGVKYNNYEVLDSAPIFVTDEVYKIKKMLESDNTPYRILYLNRQKCYLIQNALGNKAHSDMFEKAAQEGFISEDDYFDDEDYFVFIPKDFNGKLRYHTSLGEDNYDECRVYPYGIVFVRDSYAYNNKFIQALGEPERELYYDPLSEKVTIVKGNTEKVVDVEDDLGDEPNNALTYDVDSNESKADLPEDVTIRIVHDLNLTYDEFKTMDNENVFNIIKEFLHSLYNSTPKNFDWGNSPTTIFVRDIEWE